MYITKRSKHILAAAGIVLLLSGISACSSFTTSGTQTEQPGTEVTQKPEPDTSAALNEAPKETAPQGAATDSREGFDPPEEAVNAYLDGLRDRDLKRMMDTFAKDNRIAVENSESSITDDILGQYSVICRLGLDSGTIPLEGEGQGKQFVDQLSKRMKEADLSTLTFLGFLPPGELYDAYDTEPFQKGMAMAAHNDGAGQFADLAAAIDVAGKKSVLLFETAKYDDSWYIFKLGGMLSDMLDIDQTAAGAMALDAADGRRLKQEMKEHGLLAAHSARKPMPPTTAEAMESEGFDSPEMAAAAYLEGLKAGDVARMLSTFAVESYVDHYNLQAYSEQLKAYSFRNQEFSLPVVDRFSRDINIQSRKETVIDQISGQNAAVCFLNGSYYGNAPMQEEEPEGDAYAQELANMIAAMDASSLKILGYIPPEALSENYSSDFCREFRVSRASICGAGQQESCAVAFEIGGNKYVICPDAIEYNGKWYIKTFNSQLSGMLSISAGLMGTMPIDEGNMPELEAAIIPFK